MTRFRLRGPRSAADRVHLTVVLALGLLTFLQRPGSTTFDTKFDLTANPADFLARTLHLWNPQLSFGELQNQAYGYLFPQGTFFLLGDTLGVPDWVVQRLWSALILIAAYDGARRLYRALAGDPDQPRTAWLAIVAGLAFALSPRLLGLSGVLSAEILPTAVIPWVVLPLVTALRGRISPRLGGLLSGVAVLCMGGVNAVENLAALPLPALVLLVSCGTALGRRLTAWWVAATALACAWWFLPLLVLGRYSPPFLDYIETATATTRPLGWVNSTRGADHWLAFIQVGGQPWWPGAFDLATEPYLIAVTTVVAALSLAGLFHPSMPARLPLALSVLLGLVLLTIAHVAPLASPLSGTVRELLDGVLAPLRNVHKVDPLVRLPLALGFAQAVGLVAAGVLQAGRFRPWVVRVLRPAVVVGVAGLLVLSAQPLFAGDLRKPGWDAVPRAWQQAAAYLGVHADGRRALVLPGSGFGQQAWGWTIDEPLQGVARSPWVARSQVPLVPGPTIRLLDSIEARVSDGRGSDSLADLLARSGVGFVVVRRDLDLLASGAPSPSRVDQAMQQSAGLEEVASFGSTGFGDQASIVIYQVQRFVPRVEAVTADGVVRLDGGPEDIASSLEADVLGAREPVLISADGDSAPDLVGDGYRRRERQFGRLRDSLSQMMTPTENYRNERKVHDYPGVPGVRRVYARYPEIRSLAASSSSGYADTLGAVRPELGPYSAVDGIGGTYWRSAPLEDPRGQWLQVNLKKAEPLAQVEITLGVDGFSGVPVRRIRVRAGDQVSEHAVDPDSGLVRVPLTGAPVRSVRVTVLATHGDPEYGVVAIRDITFPGLALGRTLVVPADEVSPRSDLVFRAQPERRACVGVGFERACEAEEARPSEEEAGVERTFRTTSPGRWSFAGTAVARSAPATAQLLWPIGGEVRVQASSVLTDDPSISGQYAFDGNPGTPWLSARGDNDPSLTLTWGRSQTLSRLQVLPATMQSRRPSRAVIEADGERREVDLSGGSLGYFEPLRTDHVTIRFPMPELPDTDLGDRTGTGSRPVGVGDLVIAGLEHLTYAPDPNGRTGAACGLGPELVIDGTRVPTRVSGTIADVVDGRPLAVLPCGPAFTLPAGEHRLRLAATDRFVPSSVRLGGSRAAETSGSTRVTRIRTWGPTDRTVEVGPGPAAYLRVPENLNAGWQATLDGKVLEQSALDGWQQAYRLPAGPGGEVRLEYRPDGPYRTMLLVGGLLGVGLLLAAGAVLLRERRPTPTTGMLPAAFAGGLRAGPGGVLLIAAAGLVGGIWLLVGTAVGMVLRSRPVLRLWGACGLVAGTGIAAAIQTRLDPQETWVAFDAIGGLAIGLLVASLASPRKPRAAAPAMHPTREA